MPTCKLWSLVLKIFFATMPNSRLPCQVPESTTWCMSVAYFSLCEATCHEQFTSGRKRMGPWKLAHASKVLLLVHRRRRSVVRHRRMYVCMYVCVRACRRRRGTRERPRFVEPMVWNGPLNGSNKLLGGNYSWTSKPQA